MSAAMNWSVRQPSPSVCSRREMSEDHCAIISICWRPWVLQEQPGHSIGQIVAPNDVADLAAELQIHLRLGQPGQDQQQSQSCLHRRVDLGSDEACCSHSTGGVGQRAVTALCQQRPRRGLAHQVVTDDDQVDQVEQAGELHEHLAHGRDPDAAQRGEV